MPHGVPKRDAQAAFTLIEMLIVVLTLGILTGAGIRFYASLTRDTRMRTATDHLNAFVAACRRRAVERGLPVRLIGDDRRVTAVDAPALTFDGEGWTPESKRLLGGLTFEGTHVTDGSGQRITALNLAFEVPGGGTHAVKVELTGP
ncbi:MAG TPA: prepilin-type N-terminal cleavage/methylation domain-containing protein [Candidatus Ozemobacteraceae bacterium]|nr:prepilin-type N-terminal cleavage/methylation domain-containing protein [Candidatus Ozemobacteraceae bacterium]